MSFERLMREHDSLERMAQALLALARGAPAPEEAALILHRFALSLSGHRAAEQASVYRPLGELARTRDLGEHIDLDLLVVEMERDWAGYLGAWSLERIRGDWPGFARQTRDVLTQALERLRLENIIIYPLALKHGTIALRDPVD